MLSVLGGVLGLAFAVSGLNLLIAYTARFTSRVGEIGLDGRVLAFTLDRVDDDGAAVRVGAAAHVHERSRARDGGAAAAAPPAAAGAGARSACWS